MKWDYFVDLISKSDKLLLKLIKNDWRALIINLVENMGKVMNIITS